MKLTCFFIFLLLLLDPAKPFVRLVSLSYFNDTSNTVGINHARLSSSGQIVHLSLNGTDGITRIKSYNISTGSFVLQKIYTETPLSTVIPKEIMLYSTYTLGIDPTKLNFTVFTNTGTFINRYTVNETVHEYVQSPSRGIVVYVATSGKIYWVLVADFPNGNYKTLITQGIQGTAKGFMSPDTNYFVVGGSTDNKVYLIELFTKTLLHTFTLNGIDTRALSWKSDGTKIYAVTASDGIIYELLASSPFTVNTYSYESPNTVTAYHTEYYSTTNEVTIWTYKSSRSEIQIYSYYLTNSTVFRKENLTYGSAILGRSWDRSELTVFCDWSAKEVWVKQVVMTCQSGYYYDECLGMCNFCSVGCFNCTAAGCGTCPVVSVNNTTHNSTTSTNSSGLPLNSLNSSTTLNSSQNYSQNSTTTNPNHQNLTTPHQSSLQASDSLYDNFDSLLDATVGSDPIKILNQIPGSRRIFQPLLAYFGNLDDFWLYIYHQRNNQRVLLSTFTAIQNLQHQKWKLIPYETFWGHIGVDLSQLRSFLSSKQAYSSEKFIKVEGNPNGFFLNTANFFLSNLIFTVLVFLILRLSFFLLFNYKISIFLRQYSFWPYLGLIMLDGNLQFVSFLVGFQFTSMFEKGFSNKILTSGVILIFYLVFAFCIGSYFLFRYIYGKLAKYFFDNSQNTNQGAFYMMMHYGIRNILIGFVHSIDDSSYLTKIKCLFCVELIFLIFSIKNIQKENIVQQKFKGWINIQTGFLRILVIGILFFEPSVLEEGTITHTSSILVYLISAYILIGILGVLFQTVLAIFSMLSLCKSSGFDRLLEEREKTLHNMVLANKSVVKIKLVDGKIFKKKFQVKQKKSLRVESFHFLQKDDQSQRNSYQEEKKQQRNSSEMYKKLKSAYKPTRFRLKNVLKAKQKLYQKSQFRNSLQSQAETALTYDSVNSPLKNSIMFHQSK